ncbi:hypothetical protein NPIL_76291 [Nephila pilipes]|uniref:Uncharacterized protein n=1 Tax=Nephila pilipes TaxID=299642 RepID=A0A8X6TKT9_NEPPI|nr:hypothetical protein NPIL_76291 [Nephila pilipes]
MGFTPPRTRSFKLTGLSLSPLVISSYDLYELAYPGATFQRSKLVPRLERLFRGGTRTLPPVSTHLCSLLHLSRYCSTIILGIFSAFYTVAGPFSTEQGASPLLYCRTKVRSLQIGDDQSHLVNPGHQIPEDC